MEGEVDNSCNFNIEIKNEWSYASVLPLCLHGAKKVKVKVKPSRYRPGVAQEDSRKLRFPDFMTTAQECGKVVSLTHRPHLSQGNTPGTHFC